MTICQPPCMRTLLVRRSQSGQALTEFLVAALAIVPLFLLLPVIAKYQDVGHATQVASRYAAFDATINNPSTGGTKDPAQLAQEVRRRFFSNIEAPVRSNDAAGNFLAHQNLFWRSPDGTALIRDINSVGVSVAPAGASGTLLLRGVAGLFGLPDTPLYRGSVSVPLANLPAGIRSYEPFDQINLRVDRSTTLLVDGWNARDRAAVRTRVERMVPVSQAVGAVTPVLSLPFMVFELNQVDPPRVGELQDWDDLVPADRLRPRAREGRTQ
jgi:hypothetical protein